MKENDQLQLIEPAIMKHVAVLDGDGLWQIMIEHLDQLKRLAGFKTAALHALKYDNMTHLEEVFWRFYDEDPDGVRWGLIHDLGFIGKPLPIDPWAASGYLDHSSSADVLTSRELIPEWDVDSEACYDGYLFDVLDADHLDLIAGSLDSFKNLGFEDVPATRLQVRTMAKTIRNDPTLRAAYIYHISKW